MKPVPRRRRRSALLDAEIKFQTGFGSVQAAQGRDPRRSLLRQRAVRGRRACPASSTSGSPRPTSSPTTSPSPSTTGASTQRRRAPDALTRERAMRRAPTTRVRPLDRRRTRGVAVAAARRRAALLAVAALRPSPAASGRAHARARSRALRAHPARARDRTARWPLPRADRLDERRAARIRLHALPGAPGHGLAAQRVRDVQPASRRVVLLLVVGYFLVLFVLRAIPVRRAVRDRRC